MSIKKIIIVGDAGVGKTAFINNLLGDNFERRYLPTSTFNLYKTDNIEIYDTPGQSQFDIEKHYPKVDISGCIIMYDVTNPPSYKNITFWRKLINKVYGNIEITIIGNKADNNPVFGNEQRVFNDNASRQISIKDKINTNDILKEVLLCA